MKMIQKAFLFVVGVISIAFDEATKSIDELAKSMEERREKFIPKERQTKQA